MAYSFGIMKGNDCLLLGSSGALGPINPFGTDFVMVARTTTASETFTIPCQNVGTFDAEIDWGDGTTSAITAFDDADLTHAYTDAGDHTIRISGTFTNIYFNNAGDCQKVLSVQQLGNVGWRQFNSAFFGCGINNEGAFVSGAFSHPNVTTARSMLQDGNFSSVDMTGFDAPNLTTIARMYRGCTATGDLDLTWVPAVTSVESMLFFSSFDSFTGIEDWDVSNIAGFKAGENFLDGRATPLPTSQYDELLINWGAQTLSVTSAEFAFGTAKYTPGGAAEAGRTTLLASWPGLSDGGPADISARYWRVNGTTAGSYDGGALAQVAFLDGPGGTDISVGGTPFAGSEAFGGTAVRAFDKTTLDSAFWAGETNAVALGTSWVAYDFGSPVTVRAFELTSRVNPNQEQVWDGFDLDYSDDGVSWTTAQSYSDTTPWGFSETREYAA